MRGGCPARAPPDVNQIEIEVTWVEEKVRQESRGLARRPSCGNGADGAHLAAAPPPPSPSVLSAFGLTEPPGLRDFPPA